MTSDTPATPPPRTRKWRRRLLIAGGVVSGLLLLAYLILPTVVTPLVRAQLQQIVAEKLNAELQIDRISWSLPRTINLKGATLVARNSEGTPVELLKVSSLKIVLRRLPTRTTPLVIERLNLDDASIHMINTPQGWVGRGGQPQPAPPEGSAAAKRPLSQIFELRQVSIRNAQIVYEDRTRAGTVPLAWRRIDATLNTDPSTNPVYQFNLSANNQPLADVAASGSFHIDDLDVSIKQLDATLRSDPWSNESPAPARLQELLQRHQVRGQLAIHGSARLPVKQYQNSSFDFRMKLEQGSMLIPSKRPTGPDPLDNVSLTVRLASHPLSTHQDLITTAERLQTGAGAATLPARVRTEEEELAITAARLGPATQSTSQPSQRLPAQTQLAQTQPAQTQPAQTQPAQTQPAQTQPGPGDPLPLFYVRVEEGRAQAGDNALVVERAGLTYHWKDRRWQAYVRGAIDSGNQHAALPDPLETIASALDLQGPVSLRLVGEGIMRDKAVSAPGDYTLDLRVTSKAIHSRKYAVTLTDAAADFVIVPGFVHLREEGAGGARHGLSARAYGGAVSMTGQFRTSKPSAYDLMITAKDVDLKEWADGRAAAGRGPRKISGRLSGSTRLAGFTKVGPVSGLDTLTGQGELEIVEGEFYALPVLSDIFQAIRPSAEGGTVGQAAGVFTIADRKIHFSRAAVSAPVLGVQGHGVADFDGRLDFEVVAAPLADWKKQLGKANVPLIGDIAAELAGGVQKLLNTATGKLLYQFKVTGSTRSPHVVAVPAPVITENVIGLFGSMMKGSGRLLDEIKGADGTKRAEKQGGK